MGAGRRGPLWLLESTQEVIPTRKGRTAINFVPRNWMGSVFRRRRWRKSQICGESTKAIPTEAIHDHHQLSCSLNGPAYDLNLSIERSIECSIGATVIIFPEVTLRMFSQRQTSSLVPYLLRIDYYELI